MSVGQMTVMRFSCLMESNSLAPKAEKRLRQNMWKGWLTTQECVSKGLSNRQLAHPRFWSCGTPARHVSSICQLAICLVWLSGVHRVL